MAVPGGYRPRERPGAKYGPFPQIRKGAAAGALSSNRLPLAGYRRLLRFGGVFCGVNELADLRTLLIQISEVLLAQLLVNLDLLLRAVFVAGAHVGLAKPIVRVGQIGIQLQRALVFRNGVGVLALLGVEIAELQMGFG